MGVETAESIQRRSESRREDSSTADLAIEAADVSRTFGPKVALDGVSFKVRSGEIHALLGPNGAGKTTLLRILTGLLHADRGVVRTAGFDPSMNPKALRQCVGLVPSGDRTFYYRLSGLENLVFFARLYGFSRREALERAQKALHQVGLSDAVRVRVGVYSHGMQKRLSVARALLSDPVVLLVDEATHDLDPEGSSRVRDLVATLVEGGVAAVWTTQRVEEIRGFADHVTLLSAGRVAFYGTVPALMAHSNPRRFLLHLSAANGTSSLEQLNSAVGAAGEIFRSQDGDEEHFLLALAPQVVLGDAIASLTAAGVSVLSCTEEQSEIEQAFMSLTRATAPNPVS